MSKGLIERRLKNLKDKCEYYNDQRLLMLFIMNSIREVMDIDSHTKAVNIMSVPDQIEQVRMIDAFMKTLAELKAYLDIYFMDNKKMEKYSKDTLQILYRRAGITWVEEAAELP